MPQTHDLSNARPGKVLRKTKRHIQHTPCSGEPVTTTPYHSRAEIVFSCFLLTPFLLYTLLLLLLYLPVIFPRAASPSSVSCRGFQAGRPVKCWYVEIVGEAYTRRRRDEGTCTHSVTNHENKNWQHRSQVVSGKYLVPCWYWRRMAVCAVDIADTIDAADFSIIHIGWHL
ncbi:hypothetical protein F4811DRAFT_220730 [Daldinia bambusicola]|nr:hypothetical protein F4811DRAFT_220730 [Daldinia bambusicola]